MTAVLEASYAIAGGGGELFLAGGVESMTRAPYVLGKSEKPFGRSPELFDTTLGWRFINPQLAAQYGVDSMGETAENLARELSITREDQDRFSVLSQQKAGAAQAAGKFAPEIVAVQSGKNLVTHDEYLRPETTLEALAALKPAFLKTGTVTAGNSSGINDGAAALLVASESAVKRYQLAPRGRIVAGAVSGVEPRIMGIGPVSATKKALERARITLAEIDVIELNEAFAAQSLSCLRTLGIADDDPRVNRWGGAIALGHPLGMSGARLVLTALRQLEECQGRYAVCTMCIGVGQGISCIVERV
jgi:acetyl-CoA acetyltransferase family protein